MTETEAVLKEDSAEARDTVGGYGGTVFATTEAVLNEDSADERDTDCGSGETKEFVCFCKSNIRSLVKQTKSM